MIVLPDGCRSVSHAGRTKSGISISHSCWQGISPMRYGGSVNWEVESEPEVEEWLDGLSDDEFGHVEFYVDLLAERGRALREPYTRQLDGKLRELRFYLGRTRQRISYYHAKDPPLNRLRAL